MSGIQRIAMLSGIVFVAIGLLGFTPVGMGFMRMDMDAQPMLLGFFPVNAVHNLIHVAIGLWGLVASLSRVHSTVYALGSGVGYLLLGLGGLLTDTLLGIVPIGGYDVVLHLAVAVVLVGAGTWAAWGAWTRDSAVQAGAEAA